MQRRGLMFILSSPSGAGKTTLSRMLLKKQQEDREHPVTMSVSVTTRPKRPGETNGKDYFFVDQSEFNTMVEDGELLEYAIVFGNCYGTPAKFVEENLKNGTDVLFDIDWQGTRELAQTARADMVSVFILPPSMAELERRLRNRAQDGDDVIAKRMGKAEAEISHWEEYDYVLVNKDLEKTLRCIEHILEAERLKRNRQLYLPAFVEGLSAEPHT